MMSQTSQQQLSGGFFLQMGLNPLQEHIQTSTRAGEFIHVQNATVQQ